MNKANSTHDEIAKRLEENARIEKIIATSKVSEIESIVKLILAAHKAGGKVVLFGNGGSAADAQHLACELVGRVTHNRQALPAIALTTNTSTLTAVANDYGYETVFSRQVEALVDERDVVIGLSTSGNSPNVVQALKAAKKKGAKTVGLTGGDGGKLTEVADLVLTVPSNSIPRIQEAHITIGHIVCELVEKELLK
ncbi:D-sedoheptulose 7-phosphate isomerase [Chloroflexota bacterium]